MSVFNVSVVLGVRCREGEMLEGVPGVVLVMSFDE